MISTKEKKKRKAIDNLSIYVLVDQSSSVDELFEDKK